jgi:hypothetical protein
MSRLRPAVLFAVFSLLGQPLLADERRPGGLIGWVEDGEGVPIAGAVISVFGRGIGPRALVTLSDSAGRFFLSSLPPGSYTLRALGAGHKAAPAQRVTVVPDRDAVYTLSLAPLAQGAATTAAREEAARELRWLLRHKIRSVLEERGAEVVAADVTDARDHLLGSLDVAGRVEWVTNPATVGLRTDWLDESLPASRGLLSLNGRIGSGTWALTGLVSDSEDTMWRMAAEFELEPVDGHRMRAGAGYGSRLLRGVLASEHGGFNDNRGVGALSLQDSWHASDRVTATLGGRFSYIGFLSRANYLDPLASIEVKRSDHTSVRATFSQGTLAPGGDLLTLSSLSAAPAVSFARLGEGLRAERTQRYELGVEQHVGETTLRAQTFYEQARHQLVNSYLGAGATRSLRIYNAPELAARGVAVSVGRKFGEVVRGSVTYTYGRSWRPAGDLNDGRADFHDVATRVETFIEGTDTRLIAFYRFNALMPETDRHSAALVTNARFDVQLNQGLPLLGTLTGADWGLLFAVRNLFYETTEGTTLDEIVVANPPTRVLGGISVRF